MQYKEFLTIAGKTEAEINYEVYAKEIEPAYMHLHFFADKQEFVAWWKKNIEACRSMSAFVRKHNEQVDLMQATIHDKETSLQAARAVIEEKKNQVVGLNAHIETLTATMNGLKNQLEKALLRVAFDTENIIKDVKTSFFDHYEHNKTRAIELGIIKPEA